MPRRWYSSSVGFRRVGLDGIQGLHALDERRLLAGVRNGTLAQNFESLGRDICCGVIRPDGEMAPVLLHAGRSKRASNAFNERSSRNIPPGCTEQAQTRRMWASRHLLGAT
jgi:hypothetical protein